jgi:MFS superfamily sulfate permease-like transporter
MIDALLDKFAVFSTVVLSLIALCLLILQVWSWSGRRLNSTRLSRLVLTVISYLAHSGVRIQTRRPSR